ncbi:MAG: hypothetical protein ACRDM1_06900 [Gaiellaceae bacterium]
MIAVGLDSATALGGALVAQGVGEGETVEDTHVVVCAGAADPIRAVDAALDAGATILVEQPTRIPRAHLDRLVADDRVRSGLHHRYDPSLQRAAAAVRAGSIGLAWAANAESVWPREGAEVTIANLLDALAMLTALRPQRCVRVAAETTIAAVAFGHGVVGVVTSVPCPPAVDPQSGYARLHVTGSHGAVEVVLGGPRLVRAGSGLGPAPLERGSALRLLDAFEAGSAPLLREVTDLLRLLLPDSEEAAA